MVCTSDTFKHDAGIICNAEKKATMPRQFGHAPKVGQCSLQESAISVLPIVSRELRVARECRCRAVMLLRTPEALVATACAGRMLPWKMLLFFGFHNEHLPNQNKYSTREGVLLPGLFRPIRAPPLAFASPSQELRSRSGIDFVVRAIQAFLPRGVPVFPIRPG